MNHHTWTDDQLDLFLDWGTAMRKGSDYQINIGPGKLTSTRDTISIWCKIDPDTHQLPRMSQHLLKNYNKDMWVKTESDSTWQQVLQGANVDKIYVEEHDDDEHIPSCKCVCIVYPKPGRTPTDQPTKTAMICCLDETQEVNTAYTAKRTKKKKVGNIIPDPYLDKTVTLSKKQRTMIKEGTEIVEQQEVAMWQGLDKFLHT